MHLQASIHQTSVPALFVERLLLLPLSLPLLWPWEIGAY